MRSGYFLDMGFGQPLFRCELCDLDGFEEDRIARHVRECHTVTRVPYEPDPKALGESILVLGLLTWNNEATIQHTMDALVREYEILRQANVGVYIVWADNGSTDSTVPYIKSRLLRFKGRYRGLTNEDNLGQSVARNQIIAGALIRNAHYLLMLDGDIVPVAYSVASMLHFLKQNGSYQGLGCVGVNPGNYSRDASDPDLCLHAPTITDEYLRDTPQIAWTQYGLFRTDIFKSGIMFDEAKPFQGPGWGLEDDDLYLQMASYGWSCRNVYMRHAHLRRSGLAALPRDLAAKVYKERADYLKVKWGASFDRLANMTLPNV